MSKYKILHIPTGLYISRGNNNSYHFYCLVSDGDVFNLLIENEQDEEIVLQEIMLSIVDASSFFQYSVQSYTELLLIEI